MAETPVLHSFASGESYESIVFRSIDIEKQSFSESNFASCQFQNCHIIDSSISAYFENCVFEKCTFNMSKFPKTTFAHCRFKECSLIGVDFTKVLTSLGFHLILDHCNASLSLWNNLAMPESVFLHTKLTEADFRGTILTDSQLLFCDLEKASFEGADMRRSDLRGAKNYFINPFETKIRKAKFSTPEAIKLLTPLEIIIEDPPDENTEDTPI